MSDRSVLATWLRRSQPPAKKLAIAAMLSVVTGAASIVLLGGSGLLVGKAAGGGGLAALGGLLILIELVAFFRAPLRYEERVLTHAVALGSMVRWRLWLYDAMAQRIPGSLSLLASGDLLDRSIEDVDALEDLYVRIALPTATAVITALLAAVAIGIVLPVAGAVVVVALVLGLVIAAWIAHRAGRATPELGAIRGELSAASVDVLDGMVDLEMAGAGVTARARIDALDARRARASASLARRRAVGLGAEMLVAGIALLFVTLLAAQGAHRATISGAEAAAISLACVAGLEPLLGVLSAALRIPEVIESAERLDALASAPLPVIEPADPVPWPSQWRDLTVRSLCAPAIAGGDDVLEDLDLVISRGSRVAILGASGAGKSTLAHVVMRFIDPTSGQILVGDVPLDAMDADEVRSHVALLDQSAALFGGTLRDALRLGDPSASDAELLDVLHRCQLDHLVPEGVDGLARPIAEQGATLSGGQQRRIALARAILRRPEILILDEPTAGLEPAQGREVLDACLRASGPAAVLLVTHDIAETKGFDQVLWLEDGRLSELSPEEIISLSA